MANPNLIPREFSDEDRAHARMVRSVINPGPVPRREMMEGEYKILAEDLEERIRNILIQEGLTTRDLANRIGVNARHVNALINGTRNMNLQQLAKIGEALGYRFTIFAHKVND